MKTGKGKVKIWMVLEKSRLFGFCGLRPNILGLHVTSSFSKIQN